MHDSNHVFRLNFIQVWLISKKRQGQNGRTAQSVLLKGFHLIQGHEIVSDLGSISTIHALQRPLSQLIPQIVI